MSAKRIAIFDHGPVRQHGAALMVMLVILIVGAAAILVSTLTSSSLQIARDKTTADALAQAKDALIGRALADLTSPGSLPCPDIDDSGIAQSTVTPTPGSCPSYIGRLPWKTLGLPDLRDGSGERLWYAVSSNFRDYVTTNPINSDTQGSLTISGSSTANNVIAIVFSPGSTLSGQSRSTAQSAACTTTGSTVAESLCATNYLEGSNANLSTAASPNTAYQTGAASSTFNDQLITITHDQLFASVETRIAREAKICLDNYAASSNSRYPWAADDYDTTYTGNFNTYFGRIPVIPITTTTTIDSTATTMLTALSNLQVALNAYSAGVNSTTTSALLSAAQALITAAQNASSSSSFSSYSSITGNADNAGDQAKTLANGSGSSVSTVQNYINNTNYYLNSNGFIDGTMSEIWPAGCAFISSYWSSWQNEVFFQLASGNRPGSSVSTCITSCLTINGSGNPAGGNGTYRAAVIVGRAHNGSGSITSNPPSYYLEGSNLHDSTSSSSTISKTFETYRTSDASYSTVNDLVLCLDGKNNCI